MKILEHNIEIGEATERNATAEEIAYVAELAAKATAEATERETKAAAKAALLDRLGITEDEAKLLLG